MTLLAAAFLAAAPAGAAECSDGVDNDGDWAVDWPGDPDCADPGQDNEVGPEPAYTADFTAEPSGQMPELVLPSVAVSAFGSDVTITNSLDEQGGVGVAGGALPEFIEPGQQIRLRFVQDDRPRSARDVAYRVHAGPGELGPIPGEMQVELFDHEGLLLDSGTLTGLGTRELNQLFGTPHVFAFTLRPLNHPMCISGLVYTLNPPCSDGLDNDGDGLVDFDGAGGPPDPQCEGTPLGGERGPACGLGFEVVPLLLLWRRWRRRRTS